MMVDVMTPTEFMGEVIGDINARRGEIQAIVPKGVDQRDQGQGPPEGDVRVFDGPPFGHAGEGRLYDAVFCLRQNVTHRRKRSLHRVREDPVRLLQKRLRAAETQVSAYVTADEVPQSSGRIGQAALRPDYDYHARLHHPQLHRCELFRTGGGRFQHPFRLGRHLVGRGDHRHGRLRGPVSRFPSAAGSWGLC